VHCIKESLQAVNKELIIQVPMQCNSKKVSKYVKRMVQVSEMTTVTVQALQK